MVHSIVINNDSITTIYATPQQLIGEVMYNLIGMRIMII